MSKPSPNDLPTTLSNLTLTSIPKPPNKPKSKLKTLDSWEDADTSSSSEDESNRPSPPPPTPTTPSARAHAENLSSVPSIASSREIAAPVVVPVERGGGERPATTDAVARRMISAAIGVRAKSTKEQREYDAAVKAAERKKREGERERSRLEEEERERVRRGIWED